MQPPALRLTGVRLVRGDTVIVDDIDWCVERGQRWVVLGPNGSGKTSLVRIASFYLHPSAGVVEALGAVLGRIDVREHRRRIGVVSAAFADLLRPAVTALDAVMTAKYAALEPWWHNYDQHDRERAMALLDQFGCGHLREHSFGTLSSGERQRVQLARTLMASPELLLLDEPAAGLDLGAREDLVTRLGDLSADHRTPPTVLVTHHVDEVPRGFTHVLLLRGGRVLAAGPIGEVLTAERLGACFGLPLDLEQRDGRWLAWAQRTG